MTVAILVVLGLCLGSFVNALTWRLHAKKDWIKGRSECTHCHHRLAAVDLIPVLSWLSLRGRCRYCHKPIEDNPLVELVLPIVFILSYACWPLPFNAQGTTLFVFWLLFLVGFMVLLVYDLRWQLLPNKIVYPLLALAVLQTIVEVTLFHSGAYDLKGIFLGALVGGGPFYLLFQISKGKWIGGGDVKLGALLGIILGEPLLSVLLIFMASALGTMAALPLLLSGRASRTTRLPFGPFLIVAAVIVRLFGAGISAWYKLHFLAL